MLIGRDGPHLSDCVFSQHDSRLQCSSSFSQALADKESLERENASLKDVSQTQEQDIEKLDHLIRQKDEELAKA